MGEGLIAELGTILSIWAHPDDETYLAGGIMALARRNGQRVVCVSATAGERGTPDPEVWPPERLGRLRRWEAAAAMAILGVKEHRFLGYEDGELANIDAAEPVSKLRDLIAEVEPDTILTFGPDGMTGHSDHKTVSDWVTQAAQGSSAQLYYCTGTAEQFVEWGERYEEMGAFMTDDRPVGVPEAECALLVRVADEVLDQKIAALASMHSQIAPAIAMFGIDDFRRANSVEAYVRP